MNKSNSIAASSKQKGVVISSGPAPQPGPLQVDDIDKFVSLVKQGITAWTEAGQLLLAMQRADKNVFNKIIAKCEWLTVDTLMTFTRIGRMELRPEVLLLNCETGNKLMRLGYSQQSKLLDSRVAVVVDLKQDGSPLVQEKKITEMTRSDLKKIISGAKVRTVHEQVDAIRKQSRDKQSAVTAPVIKEAFSKPERKLMFLGAYRIVMIAGQPQLVKVKNLPLTSQRIILQPNMGDLDAFIELTKWSDA